MFALAHTVSSIAMLAARGAGAPADTTAPTITSSAALSVAENSAFSHTLTANESVTWTKTGGADQALFTLTGNSLTMAAKDFEAPADADANNTYIVQVTATDASGNATNQTITVTVTDVSDTAPAEDANWANVVLLAGFEGANGATSYTEESRAARVATFVNSPTISTATADAGASCLTLSGANGLTFADSPDFRLISAAGEAFTLECSFRFPTISSASDQYIINQWDTGTASRAWALLVATSGNSLRFQFSTDGAGSTSDEVITTWGTSGVAGKWYKFCVESDGTSLRTYIDGVMKTKRAAPASFFDCTTPLAIGQRSNTVGSRMTGQVDEIRITKGVARYASDAGYTPAPFPRTGPLPALTQTAMPFMTRQSSGATAYVTPSFTPANNSLLVAVINTTHFSGIGTQPLTVSGGGLTWTKQLGAFDTETQIEVWSAPVTVGAAMTMTLQCGTLSPEQYSVQVMNYTGHDAASPFGASVISNTIANDGDVAVTLPAAPAASSYVLSGRSQSSSPGLVVSAIPRTGFTEICDSNFGNAGGLQVQYITGSTATDHGWSDINVNGTTDWGTVAFALEVKKAA